MDVVLVSIAALSLVLAIGMGLILFKVLRDERQRSDARVAILAAASARFDLPLASSIHPAATMGHESSPASTRADLFAAGDEPSAWPRRAAVAAAVAASVALAGYLMLPGQPAPAPAAPAAAAAAPLELISLRYTQDAKALTITGSVQNPRNGAAVSQVFATVLLFGPDGNFLTSARAGLDFTTLSPGDESPFVVTVPVKSAVSRYRVGFRTADGAVIAHVDRRADATSTAQHSQAGGAPWGR
jgi:hypothetical protein